MKDFGMSDGWYSGLMMAANVAAIAINIVGVKQCFKEGTLVVCLSEEGIETHKLIEDVKVGDMVLAYDEETGEQAYKPVKQLFRNTTEKWCTASVLVGSVITEIVSTPGHKYYLPENSVCREVNEVQEHESYYGLSEKWVSAQNLRKGDKVLLSDGNYGIIVSVKIEELANPETTYNFEVEEFHTYYVGEQSVCVHNNGCDNYKPFKPEGKDGHRATINAGETEAPHAHIFKKKKSIGRIFKDGKMDASLSNNRDAVNFVNKYKSQIMRLIDDFYGR